MAGGNVVTVVIPAYNMEAFVLDAVHSVFAQTYKETEIIVVDDGSADRTEDVLAPYKKRLRYIRQPNQGVSSARNTGILAASGDFVAFLDADDLWMSDKLEYQMKAFAGREQIGLVACGYSVRDGSGTTVVRNVVRRNYPDRKALLRAMAICQLVPGCASGVVVRKQCFENVGIFDPTLHIGEDWDMWLRIMERYDVSFIEKILVVIRQVGGKPGRSFDSEASQVRRVIGKSVPEKGRPRALAALYARLGSNALSGGETKRALGFLVRSLCFYPAWLFPVDLGNRFQYPKTWRWYLAAKCMARILFGSRGRNFPPPP